MNKIILLITISFWVLDNSLLFSQQLPCNFSQMPTSFNQQFGRFGKVKSWTGEVSIDISTKTDNGFILEEIHQSAHGGIKLTNNDPDAVQAGMSNIWPWYTANEMMADPNKNPLVNTDWNATTFYKSTKKMGDEVTSCTGGGSMLSSATLNIAYGGTCYTLSLQTKPFNIHCKNKDGEYEEEKTIGAVNGFTAIPAKGDTLSGDTTIMNADGTEKTRMKWKLYPYSEQPKIEIIPLDSKRPHYACSKGNEEVEVRFTAEVSQTEKNGEFEKFEVRMGNKPATILKNEGGKNPLLVLKGNGKKNDKLNILAIYKKKGEFIFTQPYELNWCTIDSIKFVNGVDNLGEDCFGFNTDPTPKLEITAFTHIWKNAEEQKEHIQWEINDRGAIHFTQTNINGGPRTKFTATSLPEKNEDFGARKIKVTYNDNECNCEGVEKELNIFFPRDAQNNPEGKYPNWFYYWKQTQAWIPLAEFKFVTVIPNPKNGGQPQVGEIARYEPYDDIMYFTPNAVTKGVACNVGEAGRVGIDAFATVIRHENCHRDEYIKWWGMKMVNYGISDDCDMDELPNTEEAKLGCKSCAGNCWGNLIKGGMGSQAARDSIASCKVSCPSSPKHLNPPIGVPDNEVNAYWVGWKWKIGTADKKDWAFPGKQAPGIWKW